MFPERLLASICSVQRLRSRPVLVGAALVLLLAVLVTSMLVLGQPAAGPSPSPTSSPTATATPTPSPTPTASPSPSPTPEPAAVCPLNGLPLDDVSYLDRTAIAVQIDDHPAARPARNLRLSDMVVEATVEGDATRFTAIFLCGDTEGLTGPIRSARYYNVDVWQDLHVLTIGFGASYKTLARFASFGMPYVNGLQGGWPWFTRAGVGRSAPHNVYADVDVIRDTFGQSAALDRLAAQVDPIRPQFTFDSEVSLPPGNLTAAVEVRTTSWWRVGWRWDADLGAWRRLDGGNPTADEVDGEPVTATSVVIQRVTEEVVYGDPDPGGSPRRLHHLVGTGVGTLYVDGRSIPLKWSRSTQADGTSWTYADSGEPVILPPGRVWWMIIPTQAGITEF